MAGVVTPLTLRELYALAWLAGLQARDKPQDAPAPVVRLDDTGRAPYVRLRPDRG